MSAIAGQAAGWSWRILHRLLQIALALVLLLVVAVLALSWRLSRGPLELPWVAQRAEAAVNEKGAVHLSIGHLSLAWNGFSSGVDHAVEIDVADVAATDPAGAPVASLAHGAVALSPGRLLTANIVPRSIVLTGLRVHGTRGTDGHFDVAFGQSKAGGGGSGDLLHELSVPPETDAAAGGSRWSQLAHVRIEDAAVSVDDRGLGLQWNIPHVAADLTRQPQGGIAGQAEIVGRVGDQDLKLAVQASTAAGGTTSTIAAQLAEIASPPAIAAAIAPLQGLAGLALPVTLSGTAALDADLKPTHLHLDAQLGHGSVALGRGQLPVVAAVAHLDGTLDAMDLTLERLQLAPRAGQPVTTVTGHAAARRAGGLVQVTGAIDVDALAFADVSDIWPDGIGGKGTKIWLARNITAGVAQNAHIDMALQLPADFSDASLTALSGGLDAHDLTVHWLAPVPPLEHGEAKLSFQGPDVIEIVVTTAHQAGGSHGGLVVRGGKLRITGLSVKDQVMDIDADITGPLADLLTLLKHPRLKLLSAHPVPVNDPGGTMTGHLSLAHIPLEDKVSIDDIHIAATTHLADVHLGGIAAGRDLDRGQFDLDVTNDALKLTGRAEVAKIPTQLRVDMDFRSGPPSQVLQKASVSATIAPAQLQMLGLDTGETVGGAAAVQAEYQATRDGHGSIGIHADLTAAPLRPPRLNWTKATGQKAVADVHLLLEHDKLAAIDKLSVTGDGIDIRGQMQVAGGKPVGLRLQRIALGQAIDAHGQITWPSGPGTPWVIDVAGPLIDLSARNRKASADPSKKPEPPEQKNPDAPGTPYRIDAEFARILFGRGRTLTNLVLRADDDGRILRSASLSGHADGPFSITVTPQPGGRRLAGSVADLGGLLRATDQLDDISGGRFTLSGHFDDRTPRHTLSGNAEVSDFSLLHEPVAAKLLQAMTLYGLVDLIRGPGLKLDHLIAPFSYSQDVLTLESARVFSSSVGMTAKGSINVDRGSCDLEGTIVPAYFFNTLLGKIPLIGRVFSPEKGGGLFAATYTLRGPCDDPSVGVNPLAAVTPGFLRGVFGIFD